MRRSKGSARPPGKTRTWISSATHTRAATGPESPLRRRSALANANEGIPILGMDEDDQGRATDSLVESAGDHG